VTRLSEAFFVKKKKIITIIILYFYLKIYFLTF
jgi:hypothetical protein